MKKLIALLLVMLLALTGAAFAEEATEELNTDITVGFCPMDLSNNFFANIANSLEAYAEEMGVTTIITDGGSDAAKQVSALENFIVQGVDAIVVVPVDANSLTGIIAEAKDAGIPVITHTTYYEDATCNMNVDELEMGTANGRNAGAWLAETFGEDAAVKYAILTQSSLEQTIGRENGIKAGIAEFMPNAECVMTVDAHTTDLGITAAEDILTAHPDIVAIMGINDSGCLGAYETVVAQGIDQSKFFIGGNDGTEQALRLIKEGTCYRGSVDLNPVETGRLMIDYAIAACNGQEIPHEYMVPVAAVNIDNVDQYLAMYE